MYLNIGIDVAKNIHEACLVNDSGEQIGKFMKLRNSRKSMDKFREHIKSVSEELKAKPRIGLEATGIYWYSLYSEISRDYEVSICNPAQIRGFASVNIRGSKTDKIDAKTIANMLRFGDAPKTDYQNRQRLELREYARFYVKLSKKKANLKKRFRRNLHLVFPGYDQVFKNVFTKTSKEILAQSPTPDDILEMGEAKLLELMKKASNNYIDHGKARELIEKAEDTIPSEILKESALFELQILLDIIENIEKHILALESKMLAIWGEVKSNHYIQTITGISEIRAAIIWAEIGDIENFKHPDQIVAFAGLDPKVKKSGNKEVIGGPTKRGSSTLRWALGWAVQESKNVNPVLASYFKKKITEGKHYNTARCAAAKKLVRIIWSVEKNKKPFQIPGNLQSS
ncbi:MAG: IS110 family transposase [Candidatus Methanoperedens sp.]|nr:IS110 family transposase [Candidatus Methanoperedens sp.]